MEVLASFSALAKGINFYQVGLEDVRRGIRLSCYLEVGNAKDPNSVLLKCLPRLGSLGHLDRDASAFVAPLLRYGFVADG